LQSKLKEFLDETDEFLSKEQHGKALRELRERGSGLLHVPCSPEERRSLLLRICDIYYHNQRYDEAKSTLGLLEKEYPEASNEANFIVLQSQIYLMMGDVGKTLELLGGAMGRCCSDDQYQLGYYLGKAHFWNGDYAKADHLLQRCYRHYAVLSNHIFLSNVQYILGYMAFRRSFLDIADCYFRKALESFAVDGRCRKMGITHHMLAILAYKSGHF
jgi:tetratricopeptide (TPR) repeat protein